MMNSSYLLLNVAGSARAEFVDALKDCQFLHTLIMKGESHFCLPKEGENPLYSILGLYSEDFFWLTDECLQEVRNKRGDMKYSKIVWSTFADEPTIVEKLQGLGVDANTFTKDSLEESCQKLKSQLMDGEQRLVVLSISEFTSNMKSNLSSLFEFISTNLDTVGFFMSLQEVPTSPEDLLPSTNESLKKITPKQVWQYVPNVSTNQGAILMTCDKKMSRRDHITNLDTLIISKPREMGNLVMLADTFIRQIAFCVGKVAKYGS